MPALQFCGLYRVVDGVVPGGGTARHDACAPAQERRHHGDVAVGDRAVKRRRTTAPLGDGEVAVAHGGVEVDAEREEPSDERIGVYHGPGEEIVPSAAVVGVYQFGGEDML